MITVNVSSVSVRLLLRILRHQQSSFVLQRSENTLKMTEEALQWLNPKETTLQTLSEVGARLALCRQLLKKAQVCLWARSASLSAVSQVMSEDLTPERMREDSQDGESLASVCVQSFRERWWNKILLTGVLETDGRSTPGADGHWRASDVTEYEPTFFHVGRDCWKSASAEANISILRNNSGAS